MACDEELLKSVVNRIKEEENTYWIGMGDYCEFINLRDPRSQIDILAGWMDMADLLDISKAQINRFCNHVEPIAHKCLGMLQGNHEETLQKHYERAVYSEIVTRIKEMGGHKSDDQLAIGFYGWIMLTFLRSSAAISTFRFNVHHGFVGGRLKGAKALNMERWLWNHDCDVALMGHSHNADAFTATIEYVDRSGHIQEQIRKGGYSGTFLRSVIDDGPSTYSERRGYYPTPTGGCEVFIRPGAKLERDRIKLLV